MPTILTLSRELVKYNLNHLARVREIKALQRRYRGATLPVTVQADILTPCPTGRDCMQVHDLGLYDKKGTSRLQEIGKRRLNEDDMLTYAHPMDVSLLQKEGFKGRTEADLNPLERLLVNAAHGARAVLLRMSNDKWFTGQ